MDAFRPRALPRTDNGLSRTQSTTFYKFAGGWRPKQNYRLYYGTLYVQEGNMERSARIIVAALVCLLVFSVLTVAIQLADFRPNAFVLQR
jgi:hypothetical protein